jgi:hypothetical protein
MFLVVFDSKQPVLCIGLQFIVIKAKRYLINLCVCLNTSTHTSLWQVAASCTLRRTIETFLPCAMHRTCLMVHIHIACALSRVSKSLLSRLPSTHGLLSTALCAVCSSYVSGGATLQICNVISLIIESNYLGSKTQPWSTLIGLFSTHRKQL